MINKVCIQLDWDGLGLLKAVSDTVGNTINARHDFTYAPSGLRIRDKRTGTAPHDKRYAYTTGGALMSVYELSPTNTNTITGRRDIVYANGEAIAEIDQNNNIYELHNDYLGSPRYITNGNINQNNQSTTGKIVGEQAFGPYGEQMTGTFNGKTLPSGYRPITGYTGHINEDSTGLIYMRGRYYSPKWHRFINSDQGVDPNSINQFAYVNGRPFMATDPSGMEAVCDLLTTYTFLVLSDGRWYLLNVAEQIINCKNIDGGRSGETKEEKPPRLCEELAKLGITNENYERMKSDMRKALDNQNTANDPFAIIHEFGHTYMMIPGTNGEFGGKYYDAKIDPSTLITSWSGLMLFYGLEMQGPANGKGTLVYSSHTHPNLPGQKFGFPPDTFSLTPELVSKRDYNLAGRHPENANHFMGWDGGFMHYGYKDGNQFSNELAGPSWWDNIDCSKWLRSN